MCLQQSSPIVELNHHPIVTSSLLPLLVPSKAERKAFLKAARQSKKLRYMDDPTIAEAAHLTALRDEWLIQRVKPSPATKLQMKQAAEQENREKAKQGKRQDKTREKAQAKANDIRKLATSNQQVEVDAFQAILSDPPTAPTDNPLNLPLIIQVPLRNLTKEKGLASAEEKLAKKNSLSNGFNKQHLLIETDCSSSVPRNLRVTNSSSTNGINPTQEKRK